MAWEFIAADATAHGNNISDTGLIPTSSSIQPGDLITIAAGKYTGNNDDWFLDWSGVGVFTPVYIATAGTNNRIAAWRKIAVPGDAGASYRIRLENAGNPVGRNLVSGYRVDRSIDTAATPVLAAAHPTGTNVILQLAGASPDMGWDSGDGLVQYFAFGGNNAGPGVVKTWVDTGGAALRAQASNTGNINTMFIGIMDVGFASYAAVAPRNVEASHAISRSGLTVLLPETEPLVPPSTPTGLHVTSYTDDEICLAWDENPEDGIVYTLQRERWYGPGRPVVDG